MNTIWLDIGLMQHHHIHHNYKSHGILRVERECCRDFLDHSTHSIRFCYYNFMNKRFEEIPRAQVIDMINFKPAPLPSFSNIKERVYTLIWKLPISWQNPVTQIGVMLLRAFRRLRESRLIKKIKKIIPFASSFVKKRFFSFSTHDQKIIFSNNDVYIYLSADVDQDFLYLYQLKQKLNLSILFFCHDIIPVLLPHLAFNDYVAQHFAAYYVNLAWTADTVMCYSQSTKKDLELFLTHMITPVPNLKTVRLGSNFMTHKMEMEPIIKEPYILYVSTIEIRKNHALLYNIYTRWAEEKIAVPKLIFVGARGWLVDDLLHAIKYDPRIQDHIILLNDVSDNDLVNLYQHALFTVYPSLYEGWGLPVAESLGYGKFCLASNTSSLPEVGGEFVEYIDPLDTLKWMERLRYYIENPHELKKREQLIKSQYQPYAWRDTAQTILQESIALLPQNQ